MTTLQPAALAPAQMSEGSTIKSRIINSWPAALVGLGLVLTIGWNVGLLWLLYRVV